ncbi:Os01g0721700, partial [Oryza sativa Japonica Group]
KCSPSHSTPYPRPAPPPPTPVACELSGARSGGYDWATADPGKASCSLVLPSPMTPTSLSSRRRRPPLDAVNVGSGLA